jgi:hypothetical protein
MSLLHTVTASTCYASTTFLVFLTGFHQLPLTKLCPKIITLLGLWLWEVESAVLGDLQLIDLQTWQVQVKKISEQKQVVYNRIDVIGVTAF